MLDKLRNLWFEIRFRFNNAKPVLFLISLLSITWVIVWFTFNYLQTFSAFSAALGMFSVVLVLSILTDRYIFRKIDTIEELKNGNIAVAIAILALAIIFHACLSFV